MDRLAVGELTRTRLEHFPMPAIVDQFSVGKQCFLSPFLKICTLARTHTSLSFR